MKIIQKIIAGSGLVIKRVKRKKSKKVTYSCIPGQKMDFKDGKRVG